MIIHMRYRGWSSRMWESGYQLIWKKRDDTGLFWTRRKFVNATTRSQERMTISGDSHVRQRSQRILDPVLTLFTVVLKVCKSTDVPKRDWCRMTYHLARLILDGYFNPLVFWYQWEYLRSPANNLSFFAGYLRLAMNRKMIPHVADSRFVHYRKFPFWSLEEHHVSCVFFEVV